MVPDNPRWFSPPAYGLTQFKDLFTARQLTALVAFSDLIGEAREQVVKDALDAGLAQGQPLVAGGTGAEAYGESVATYLAFALSAVTDRSSSLVSWVIQRESTRNTFTRQAIQMVWDFVEMNLLLRGTGSFQRSHMDRRKP